jgi:hypothetical protein
MTSRSSISSIGNCDHPFRSRQSGRSSKQSGSIYVRRLGSLHFWLFLPGTGWTHNNIATNDLRFHVEGKPYPIPSKAEVSIAR